MESCSKAPKTRKPDHVTERAWFSFPKRSALSNDRHRVGISMRPYTTTTKWNCEPQSTDAVEKQDRISESAVIPEEDDNTPIPIKELRRVIYQFNSAVWRELRKKSKRRRRRREFGRVTDAIMRKYSRIRAIKLYNVIRSEPELMMQMTNRDFQALVEVFTPNPDSMDTVKVAWRGIQILKDLQRLESPNATFRQQDAEALIYLCADVGNVVKAEQAMQALVAKGKTPSARTYSVLISRLAQQGNMASAEAWLKNMRVSGHWPPSESILGSLVDGYLRAGDERTAMTVLREYSPEESLARRALEAGKEDRTVLDVALHTAGMEYVKGFRLNDARRVYQQKWKLGCSSVGLLKALVAQGMENFQTTTMWQLLQDTLNNKDREGLNIVAGYMLKCSIQRDNIKDAIRLWRLVSDELDPNLYAAVLSKAAQARYHEDTMLVYRKFRKQYPNNMTIDLFNSVLSAMVYSKSYKYAFAVYKDLKRTVPPTEMNTDTLNALYGLCAQTGDLSLLAEVTQLSEKGCIDPGHKAMASMMACYLTLGNADMAKEIFDHIAKEREPDVVEYNLLIRAMSMKSAVPEYGALLAILRHMASVEKIPEASTYRTLMDAYRDTDMEQRLMEQIIRDPKSHKRDHVFVNNMALTRIIAKEGPDVAARKFLTGHRGAIISFTRGDWIDFDGMTYKILLDSLVQYPRHAALAERVYMHMRSRGFKPHREVYEQLILCWVRKGRILKARRVMAEMEADLDITAGPNVYTILMDGLSLRDKPELIIDVFKEMIDRGIEPDNVVLERLKRYLIEAAYNNDDNNRGDP